MSTFKVTFYDTGKAEFVASANFYQARLAAQNAWGANVRNIVPASVEEEQELMRSHSYPMEDEK
jgi:hypothetical protein